MTANNMPLTTNTLALEMTANGRVNIVYDLVWYPRI